MSLRLSLSCQKIQCNTYTKTGTHIDPTVQQEKQSHRSAFTLSQHDKKEVRRMENLINSSHQPKPKGVAKARLGIDERLSAKQHQFINISRRITPPAKQGDQISQLNEMISAKKQEPGEASSELYLTV